MSTMTPESASSKTLPGPRGLPIFGSLFSIRNDTHLAIDLIAKQYGDICSMRFGSVPTVVISHPDLLKEAFDKTELADRWGAFLDKFFIRPTPTQVRDARFV